MASNYLISIILKAVTGDAKRELKGFAKEMSSFQKVATVAMGAIGSYYAMQLAQNLSALADWAAKNMEVAASFESLADRYDLDSDRIVAALKKASKGTVSEQQLILQANKAMRLGVATTVEEFEGLMKIAYVRAKEFGLTVAEAWEYIVTGVGRASPMILDNIGILLDAERVNTEYAESIGKTANELTIYEKKQALVNSILKEGAQDLEEWADKADTAADKTARMTAEVEEAKQAIGEAAAVIKGELAVAFLDAATTADQLIRILEGLASGTVEGTKAAADYRGWLGRVAATTSEATTIQEAYRQAMMESTGVWGLLIAGAERFDKGIREDIEAMRMAQNIVYPLADSMADLADETEEATKAADKAHDIWHDYLTDIGEEAWQFAHRMEEMAFRQTQAAEDAGFRLYEIERDSGQRRADLLDKFWIDEESDLRRHQMRVLWATQDFQDSLRDMEWEHQQEKRDILDRAPPWIRQALAEEFRERRRIVKSGDKDALRAFDKNLKERIRAIDPAYAKELDRLQERYRHERQIEKREHRKDTRRRQAEYTEENREQQRQLDHQLRVLERELGDQIGAWRFHDQQRLENERWAMDNLNIEYAHALDRMESETDYRLSELPPLYKHYGYSSWTQWLQGWTDAQRDYPMPVPIGGFTPLDPGNVPDWSNPFAAPTLGAPSGGGGVNVTIEQLLIGSGATPMDARKIGEQLGQGILRGYR